MPSATDDDAFGLPLAKRQRVSVEKSVPQQLSGSKIFSPFRTLGLVSPTAVPFSSIPLGKTTFQITTSVGRCLQTYDLRRGLNLVFLSRPQTPEEITATYAWKDRVFAAWEGSGTGAPGGVWVFKRGKKVAELETPVDLDEPVEQLLVFGSWIVGCCGKSIHVWKSQTYEHYTTLRPSSMKGASGDRVLTGRMCTMPTYLNKIFAGKYDGGIDIWNVGTGKLIYTILPASPNAGPVTALQPAPALSLMAVAYGSGALTIHDIHSDQPALELRSPSTNCSAVTSISFRTDGLGAGDDGRKTGVMATAGIDSGDITMWDLNNGGRVTGVLRSAHEITSDGRKSGINKIEFLAAQPVMVSTGMDNALRSWIFDETPFSPIPRILHARSGHSAPATTLNFLPAGSDGSESTGKWLLSAAKDHSLWGFSLRKDGQNTELSQGNVKSKSKKMGNLHGAADKAARSQDLKAPEITCMACSLNRDGGMGAAAGGQIWANTKGTNAESSNATGWESIVTGHKGDKFARTWFWGRKKAGRWAFPTTDGTEVKSVAVSPCGTFALVGSAGGSIDMFNLQSGFHRQRYPAPLKAAEAKKLKLQQLGVTPEQERKSWYGHEKHTKSVTGLAVDGVNRTVVSCGLDGKLKFWELLTGRLIDQLDWYPMSAITALRYNRSSDLLAVSCDDLSIRIVDIETMKLVRELWGCVGQVNDFCFSNDGRWIIAASMDSTIRVWDLPTGHLIDAFRLESTCLSLAFSGTGEFLATAHADGVGINVWNNRTLFMHVPTRHIDEDRIVEVAAPTASGEGGAIAIEAAFNDNDEEDGEGGPAITSEQLSDDMMTLSVVPKSRWQTLLNLDVIKQRNKPIEPPKAPKSAPFFLPTTVNVEGAISAAKPTEDDAEASKTPEVTEGERSRIAKMQRAHGSGLQTSQFTSLLYDGCRNGTYDNFIEYLKTLSPAKADLEIRSLDPRSRNNSNELANFVSALTERLRTKRDFELVNAWMSVFLRVHSDAVRTGLGGEEEGDSAAGDEALQDALAEWKVEQQREGQRLSELVGYCRGVVGFLRSSR